MQIHDWYMRNDTGQLFEVVYIDEWEVGVSPIEDIDGTLGDVVYTASSVLESDFKYCDNDETIDDIIEEYLHYDFDRKFYRIGYVSFAIRIKRAWERDGGGKSSA